MHPPRPEFAEKLVCLTPSRLRRALVVSVLLCSALASLFAQGVPLTRLYPYEEIGCAPGGVNLVHDTYGRVAIAQEDRFIVLNDLAWKNIRATQLPVIGLRRVARDGDGQVYFGGLGSWGVFKGRGDGRVEPVIATPSNAPAWVKGTFFDHIFFAQEGVYFGGLQGVAYWERSTGRVQYFALSSLACLFQHADKVIASTFDNGMFELELETGQLKHVVLESLGSEIPRVTAGRSDGELLVGTAVHNLYAMRDGRASLLAGTGANALPGRVVSLVRLPEGSFAMAISGYGILLVEADGSMRTLLSGPEYEGVTALSCLEPGVLWAAIEKGLLKVLYGQPITTVGRAQGVMVEWPQVVFHKGAPVISSGGHIYELEQASGFRPPRFKNSQAEPNLGAWGIAVVGNSLLLGNGKGIFAKGTDGNSVPVVAGMQVARLVPIDAETCLAIAADSIAAVRLTDGFWRECAPRIKGVGYPYIAHAAHHSAWLELGVNRVARIALKEQRLELTLLEQFPWSSPSWINVSILGETVVLSGAAETPIVLNERTLSPEDNPDLVRLLAVSPHRIKRLSRDTDGTYWLSHERGLFAARLVNGSWAFDLNAYHGINGPPPLIVAQSSGQLWASTGSSLYHLRAPKWGRGDSRFKPVLVSARDARTHQPILLPPGGPLDLGSFEYDQNSIQLGFFSGSYDAVRRLDYEFRLNGGGWMRNPADSPLLLSDLREGSYGLAVRMVDDLGPIGAVSNLTLMIEAPWYRRWQAYVAFLSALALIGWGFVGLSSRWARMRSAALERLVTERTSQLRLAMDRLHQETMTSATLAERNRLAVEIHDSLEQGFTGIAMQLESLAALGACPDELKAGLRSALNMVSYCRDEIRHAVRGLHSPILTSVDLGDALRHIVNQLTPIPGFVSIYIRGEPRAIDPAKEHHLLRIAQEALANAEKHSCAQHVDIVLHYHKGHVELNITDNGRGFATHEILGDTSAHFGVRSFRSRAAKMGGEAYITSAPGKGTTVLVRVPFQEEGGSRI